MNAQGLLQPIGLLASAYGDRFEVIWGHRRTRAARLAGWLHIDARVYPHGTDVRQARMAENAFHEALTPLEEARECASWKQDGMPVAEIARRRRRSIAWVEERIAMLAWPEDIRRAVAAGTLTLGVARELVSVDFGPYRADLVAEAARNGATARVVAAWAAAYHADRERIVTNSITVEEIAQRRHEFTIKAVCEVCGQEVPLDRLRTIRMCAEEYADLLQALKQSDTAS